MPTFGWDWPIQYLGVPEQERADRVQLDTDTCVIDGQWFFVRGCLEIPVHGHDEPFSWGVWLSLSKTSFGRFGELYEDVSREPGEAFFGWLCSAIPGYSDTQSLKTYVHVRPWPTRPYVELEPTDHLLAVEQREGITRERVAAIYDRLVHGHGPGSRG
jgi:hypothetical protein